MKTEEEIKERLKLDNEYIEKEGHSLSNNTKRRFEAAKITMEWVLDL